MSNDKTLQQLLTDRIASYTSSLYISNVAR